VDSERTHMDLICHDGRMHDLGDMKNWPELQALGLLVALSGNARSIGQASAKLDLAQHNASRSLRNLERDLKDPLLRRSPRGTELTVEGQAVGECASKGIEAAGTPNSRMHTMPRH